MALAKISKDSIINMTREEQVEALEKLKKSIAAKTADGKTMIAMLEASLKK